MYFSKVFAGKRRSSRLCCVHASTCVKLFVCVALVKTCTDRLCIFVNRVCRLNKARRVSTPYAPYAK